MSTKTLRTALTWFILIVASVVVFFLALFQGLNSGWNTTYLVYEPVVPISRTPAQPRQQGGTSGGDTPVVGNTIRELRSKGFTYYATETSEETAKNSSKLQVNREVTFMLQKNYVPYKIAFQNYL